MGFFLGLGDVFQEIKRAGIFLRDLVIKNQHFLKILAEGPAFLASQIRIDFPADVLFFLGFVFLDIQG